MTRNCSSAFAAFALSIAAVFLAAAEAPAAVTVEPTDTLHTSTTFVTLSLDTAQPVPVRTSYTQRPPAIVIEFPLRRVTASLPERSVVSHGVIRAITASYDRPRGASASYLRTVQIELSGPYAFQARSEARRLIIEIEHPASVGSTSVDVGLAGGTILRGRTQPPVSERFHAMQKALANMTGTPWTIELGSPASDLAPEAEEVAASAASARIAVPPTRPKRPIVPPRPASSGSPLWAVACIGLALAAGATVWWLWQRGIFGAAPYPVVHRTPGARLSSGVALIDQLVWKALERQGFELVAERDYTQPLAGTLRVAQKEGAKSAIFFIGHAPFFDKRTVERFLRMMQDAGVERGLLAASGSFTVPAHRAAKQHGIALIGREQLTELLGIGAAGEHVRRELEEQQVQLAEAKATLKRYTDELEALRRQRNEASWYLGEERERAGRLEAQLAELGQSLQQHEAGLGKWEYEAQTFRRQWEESEWYLGESRARVRHLEEQLSQMQALVARTEAAEQERDQVGWYLGEERARREAAEAHVAGLDEQLEASRARERLLNERLEQLREEIQALRLQGERRGMARVWNDEATVELFNGTPEPLSAGRLRNLSRGGISIEAADEVPAQPSFRVRLSVPGHEPIESRAELIWQRPNGDHQRYQSGFRFTEFLGASDAGELVALLDKWQRA